MMIRLFLAVLIFCFVLPVYAKNSSGSFSSVEQITQRIFQTANMQIATDGFPQFDIHRAENLRALNSVRIIDDRTVSRLDNGHYIISFNSERNYNKSYIFNFDGTLAYVDFIIYPSYIKSYEDYTIQTENENKIYPYYVYRHNNSGYLEGIWYITKAFAYFFEADKSLRYKCDMLTCTDTETGQTVSRYYH